MPKNSSQELQPEILAARLTQRGRSQYVPLLEQFLRVLTSTIPKSDQKDIPKRQQGSSDLYRGTRL